jgi:hypothetical protein
MGSPVSPIVANLYMESFEAKAISTARRPPTVWFRYVDDTFVVTHKYNIEEFTKHINSIDPNIQFTMETEENGSIPFLNTRVHLKDDGGIKTTVYRKPTHTDQYLAFGLKHHLNHKRSVVRSLLHRVDKIVSEDEAKTIERKHIHDVLKDNGYDEWMLKIPKPKKSKEKNKDTTTKSRSFPLLYVKGVSEDLSKIFRRHGIGTYHKPYNSIRNQLVKPKDKTPDIRKCGVIYELSCEQCHKVYIGEKSRSFGTRLKEHRRQKGPLTAVGEHIQNTGHNIAEDSQKVIAREDSFWPRKIRESIEIRLKSPALNRDGGYSLPPIYSTLLTGDLGPRSPDLPDLPVH